MSNVEFPGADQPPITETDIETRHAEAFRDLEGKISDCRHMASIALQMAECAIEGRDDKHEKAMFAVFQTADTPKKLQAAYYAAWHAESVAFERTESVYGDDADCPELSAALHARARPRSPPSGTERMVQQARIRQGAMLFVRGRLCCQRC